MVSECRGVSLVLAYDLTQSTGPATQQGSDGSMSTLHGTGIDSKSGKMKTLDRPRARNVIDLEAGPNPDRVMDQHVPMYRSPALSLRVPMVSMAGQIGDYW
jgi:hypothetical protein